MTEILRIVIETAIKKGHSENSCVNDLVSKATKVNSYSDYLRRELLIVPITPIVLIFLYGSALIAECSFTFRIICIFLMVYLVVYLAIAAVTSTRLACEYLDLEKTIIDLEELRRKLDT